MTDSEKEQIFIQMLNAYKHQIYRVCWGFTSNQQDVEDLFQEVVLNVLEGFSFL